MNEMTRVHGVDRLMTLAGETAGNVQETCPTPPDTDRPLD
jgi:hypothetical protein